MSWPWPIIKFCCEEITRQRDVVMAVPDLLRAWEEAIAESNKFFLAHIQTRITVQVIKKWGFLAKPSLNAQGFRRHNVQVGEHDTPVWQEVPRLMTAFCEAVRVGEFLPAQAYYEYEMIHPFADGNGRTGKILYNFLLGTLLDPQMPPNFWGNDNP